MVVAVSASRAGPTGARRISWLPRPAGS